jgi:hypothetical protein
MQDLVDTVRDPAASDEASASSAQDRLQELLQRIRRDLAAPEMSSARARLGAIAASESGEARHVSPPRGDGPESFGPMEDPTDTSAEPAASEHASASSAHDGLQKLLRLIGRDLAASEISSAPPGLAAIAQPQSGERDDASAMLDEGQEPIGPGSNVGQRHPRRQIAFPQETAFPQERAFAQEAELAQETEFAPETELAQEFAQETELAPETEFPQATAFPQETDFPQETAFSQDTAFAHGNPVGDEVFAGSRACEQAAETPVRETSRDADAIAWAPGRPTYQAYGGIGANDYSDLYGSPRSGRNRVPPQRRGRGRTGAAVAGIATCLLVGTLGTVGYYALSASKKGPRPLAIADNLTISKSRAAGQSEQREELNQQAANAPLSNQPNSVRTVALRSDVGVASTSAAEAAQNDRPASNTVSMPRAYANMDERPRVLAASTSAAAALSNSQSEPNAPPAPRARTNVDGEPNIRTSVARPQAPARNGEVACQASPGRGGWWAWRQIDGRKCWYEGKIGMSKDNLRWVR